MTSLLLVRSVAVLGIHPASLLRTIELTHRYSPEDHAILEAEFKKNSKPDKTARLAIVERVALGEKEVQVYDAHVPG